MNKIQRKRLEKLIGFLKTLDNNKFNFYYVITRRNEKYNCGAVCCAIGWTPAIFPNLVKWGTSFSKLKWKNERILRDYGDIACELFGIRERLSYPLFRPGGQFEVHGDLEMNKGNSPKQVAKMLEKFLKLVDKKEIILQGNNYE